MGPKWGNPIRVALARGQMYTNKNPSTSNRGCSLLRLIHQVYSVAALGLHTALRDQSRTSVHKSIKSMLTVTRLCPLVSEAD